MASDEFTIQRVPGLQAAPVSQGPHLLSAPWHYATIRDVTSTPVHGPRTQCPTEEGLLPRGTHHTLSAWP